MPLPGFLELLERADARRQPVTLAAAGGADPTVLLALAEAQDRGWIEPVVVGEATAIRREAALAGVDLAGFRLVDAAPDAVADAAVAEVREGRAAVLMKGRIATPDLMRAIGDPERGIRTGRTVCQVVLMEIIPQGRRFLLADTGVVVSPKVRTKAQILLEAVGIAHALGLVEPAVAILAATEAIHASMPETIDADELRRLGEAGEFPGCRVQGPLSFDLAYAPEAARRKGFAGPSAGAADILIFPNLSAANLSVKAIMYTADCRYGGVLRGTTHPVAFMSRSDDVPTRMHSLALALRLVR